MHTDVSVFKSCFDGNAARREMLRVRFWRKILGSGELTNVMHALCNLVSGSQAERGNQTNTQGFGVRSPWAKSKKKPCRLCAELLLV